MNLKLIGHEDRYAVEQLQLALFSRDAEGQAVSRLYRGKSWLTATAEITLNGRTTRACKRLRTEQETVPLRRRILQQSYYLAALPHLEQAPSWGALAGVRPTKLTTRHMLEGGSVSSARRMMEKIYYVSPERSRMAAECSESTVAAARKAGPGDISLYVGIPFCPTRCAYCSFVSRSIGRRTDLLEPYLQALLREIRATADAMADTDFHIRSLYIGGGTPTTLSQQQMERLLDGLQESFDLSRCIEFTVEAGRPDTLTPEKLRSIREHGADRVSINPQTMNDRVLRASGRPHTGADVLRCYQDALDAGFTEINMDLIAGLPEDTAVDFCRSLDQVAALDPANITVHTLALKKGADLFERKAKLPSGEDVAEMLRYAGDVLRQKQYRPYYLYRQKYMSGSFENVGWSRDGLDCLYNIYMMEELHTILSLGGGGMTKVNLPDGTLRRFHNPKFPEQYIEQLQSVLDQKQELFAQMKGSI